MKTYIGSIDDAVATADAYAHRALEEIRSGLEPRIEAAS